jgi:hypothetical protein
MALERIHQRAAEKGGVVKAAESAVIFPWKLWIFPAIKW